VPVSRTADTPGPTRERGVRPERRAERSLQAVASRPERRQPRPRSERPAPSREGISRSGARPVTRRRHEDVGHRQVVAAAGEVSSARERAGRERVVRARPAHERFDRKQPAREAATAVQTVVERLRHRLFAAKR
jgi:hypothetical protein